MIRPIDLIPSPIKLFLAIAFDVSALTVAFFIAYILRLGISDVSFSTAELTLLFTTIVTTICLFYFYDVYNTVVRYFNTDNALKIVILLTISVVFSYSVGFFLDAFIPRSIPIVVLTLSIFSIVGVRGCVSFLSESQIFREKEPVIVYGADTTGRELVRSLFAAKKYHPLAFIDEKKRFHGRVVLGLKIYPIKDIELLLKRHGHIKVLIAVSQVDILRMKEIIAMFEPFAVELLTIPNMSDIVSGKRSIDDLREISVHELLGREAVNPMPELMAANIKNKIVLVSGAGGSIGKELCRQIIQQQPKKLVLLDISEAFLYEIDQELSELKAEKSLPFEIVPLIGNVQNGMLMSRTLEQHNIDTIYHAAAYKHVPMVENNVIAGITNNVLGTAELAQAAILANVSTFVLISTDKAVRPTNVMGATKRMAELVLQGLAKQEHNTRFVMVRFGNVLGSSGSVVPLFKKQIKRGGPITVTHPDIIRYFMTIPEAAQLVIQAGAMGKGGDVFVLDMGEPVKIVDLAYKMAHLMGLTIKTDENPSGDIAVKFSGLRPGEKLYEELLIDDHAERTFHRRILTANEKSITYMEVNQILARLIDAMTDENIDKIKQLLIEAPLGYQPKNIKLVTETLPLSVAS